MEPRWRAACSEQGRLEACQKVRGVAIIPTRGAELFLLFLHLISVGLVMLLTGETPKPREDPCHTPKSCLFLPDLITPSVTSSDKFIANRAVRRRLGVAGDVVNEPSMYLPSHRSQVRVFIPIRHTNDQRQ